MVTLVILVGVLTVGAYHPNAVKSAEHKTVVATKKVGCAVAHVFHKREQK